MADDVAVLEAPETGAELEATDLSTTETGTENTGAETVDNNDTPQSNETGHLRGSELYRAVKEKLKASGMSPQEIRSIRNAIHIAGKADEVSGGDLGRLQSEREAYGQLRMDGEESYSPEQLVEQVRADRQQLQEIRDDIASGGQKMLAELEQDNPEALESMTFQSMDRIAQRNNEAFSTYVAKSAFGYLVNKQIPQQMQLLDEFLLTPYAETTDPGVRIILKAANSVKAVLQDLGAMSQRELKVKTPTQVQNGGKNTPEQDLATREHNIRRSEWNSEAASPNQRLRDEEIKQLSASRKVQLTEKERSEVLAAVKDEYDTRLAANGGYMSAMKGYVDANNKRAYMDRVASEGKKLLPSIIQRHFNAVLEKRKSAPAQTQQKTAGKPAQAVERTDATGTVWLAGSPASQGLQVDHTRTTHAMLVQNQAYIRGRQGIHKWKARTA